MSDKPQCPDELKNNVDVTTWRQSCSIPSLRSL